MHKVVTEFILNQTISFPVFFPELKNKGERILPTLDVHRQFRYLSTQDSTLLKDSAYSIWRGKKRNNVLWNKLFPSGCLGLLFFCYAFHSKTVPSRAKAHSTRVFASSTAFWKRVDSKSFLEAPTWSTFHNFTKLYKLDSLDLGQDLLSPFYRVFWISIAIPRVISYDYLPI